MDTTFILFLFVIGGLATIFGILFYKFKDYSPSNKRNIRARRIRIRKMRIAAEAHI